jgi:hypothetical protein
MTIPDRSDTWTKSSYSTNTDNCVEVKTGHAVGVRDTKDRRGGQLAVNVGQWSAFLTAVKTEQ